MSGRKQKDFSKGKIYVVRNTVNDMVYVGSTCQSLSKRMAKHRTVSKTNNCKHYPLYKAFNEIGVDHFYIELIENYPCENIEQLLAREGHYIRNFNTHTNGYNKRVEGRTDKEYYQNNKEQIAQKNKEWRDTHKHLLQQYFKDRYKENKVQVLEKRRHYRDENKEQIRIRANAKIQCDCGCEVSYANLAKHKQSTKHTRLMQQPS